MMYSLRKINGGYGGKQVIHDVSFEVEKGQLFGILGPNGSGKSTVLKMLSGLIPVTSGEVYLKDQPVQNYNTKEIAKIVAVLPQHAEHSFSYTVKEIVSLGRYAHQSGWFQTWSEDDEEVVQRSMKQTGVQHFAHKNITELSGGERQRVFLAQSLAQEPEILLLDEPTNHLDLSYQKELLDMLKEWTEKKGLTVISIFHDLNLAGLYCDQIVLLNDGKIVCNDKPNEVLQEARIIEVYETEVKKHGHPKVPAPQVVLIPEEKWHNEEIITPAILMVNEEYITLQSAQPLRVMSSGVVGSGIGWYQTFVNRHVDKSYNCDDFYEEMVDFLIEKGFEPSETVGMMTAVYTYDVIYEFYEMDLFSVLIVVTAGVGNAVDASMASKHKEVVTPGTINSWIFVNGHLSEEAFIQAMMTATEAKAKVLMDLEVRDKETGTVATGTSTDSILVAATQSGEKIDFAGTVTPLGKIIGKGIYECTQKAIHKSRKRKKETDDD